MLAQAVADKKVRLEDDIRDYLPGKYPNLAFEKRPVQLKHLANHTSGLPSIPENMPGQANFDSLNPYQHYTKTQLFAYLKTVIPIDEPGTVCAYSNLGMALLGLILEAVYHQTFEALVREKICDPNRMVSTAIHLNPEQSSRFADGYNQSGQATPHWELNDFDAAGGLRASTADMLKYLEYNLAEKEADTRLAHQVSFSKRETLGLAWFIKKTDAGNTLVWHNGGTYGFSGFNGFIREKDCAVIILSNSSGSLDYIGIGILKYLQGL